MDFGLAGPANCQNRCRPRKKYSPRAGTVALRTQPMNRLRREYATPQKHATLEVIKALLDVGNSEAPPSYQQAAVTLHVSIAAVKTLVHRLRKQYKVFVHEDIERTVSGSDEIDAEIHELCEALVASEGWILP
jgi:hypothetical protein